MTLTIRPASAPDLAVAIELLEQAGLPVADLSTGHLAFVAEKNVLIQGVIGIEVLGDIALLRSLVVSADARGAGIGVALVTALEVSCIANDGQVENLARKIRPGADTNQPGSCADGKQ